MSIRRLIAASAAVGLLVLGGCRDSAPDQGHGGTVTVFAAASLTEAFTKIGKDFEAANPGTSVRFSFAGSSALAAQIGQGAPADVFASASPANMQTVVAAGAVAAAPVTFVRNQLVIATAKGNPKAIKGLSDLATAGTTVASCAEQVPCGAAARKALDAAGVALTPVTLEHDVKAALAKVRLGEVDAALVYRTDARAAAADVDAVEFPESAAAINDYPIATLKDAPNAAGGQAFVDYVRSAEGLAVLTAAGFQAP
ncbi:molybdate ABC transporter substrate-binding protein [Luedemannella helvata]|uniref:Molybdate ABC transporter substrate-binding protein n=1 Tax=Luedemannella helvata TaxID=349315 RepID=A0ABN2L525_9ACTN